MKKITYMPSRQKGLTLIELMVGIAIGLLVVAGIAYPIEVNALLAAVAERMGLAP